MPPDILHTEIGRIEALNVRATLHDLPRSVGSARAVAGLGLEGDIHSHPLSLRQLLLAGSSTYRSLELPAQTLRENLLLTVETSGMKSGTVLAVGDSALLWLTFQCEACGHLNDHVHGMTKTIGNERGMLARVLHGGEIAVGDVVRDLGRRMPAWSDDWKRRVVKILDLMPQNAVIEYKQLAWLAGIAPSYCRVFPRFLRGLGQSYDGRAVSMTDRTTTPRWQGEGLYADQFVNRF
jgi:hypothetical protein